MREVLDQWAFVTAAYVIAGLAMALTIAGSWLAMRRAEKRRDKSRDR